MHQQPGILSSEHVMVPQHVRQDQQLFHPDFSLHLGFHRKAWFDYFWPSIFSQYQEYY
uniref:Uncharacterized protein n=1 Tax=Arundo donax TaxID=35708 RepID=A0A0A8YFX6_ARUDO